MATVETWYDQDLNEMVPIQPRALVFKGDQDANKIGVRITKGGQPYSLTGTIRGYLVKPNGSMVTISGSRSGNTAYLTLPASVYELPGNVLLTIKEIVGNTACTLCACTGIVYKGS